MNGAVFTKIKIPLMPAPELIRHLWQIKTIVFLH
jgi:hypothetical protein